MTSTSESDSAANPYTAPVASLAGESVGSPAGRSRLLLISNWLLFVIALMMVVGLQLVASAYREMYFSFGVDIPAITELWLRFSPAFFLLPLLQLIPTLLLTLRKNHSSAFRQRMGWISAGGSLLVLGLLAWSAMAIYWPTFGMDVGVHPEEVIEK